MKVCIDPGHGGKDVGATGALASEKSIALLLSLLFGKELLRNGITVVYTRADDTYVDLQERSKIASKNKCDYFISFHCNYSYDPEECGSEIFCYRYGGVSEALAKHMLNTLIKVNKHKDLKVREGEFHILKNASMPSVLIQIMYLSNPREEGKLMDPLWQRIFAEEMAWSFLSFIGKEPSNNYQKDSIYKTSIMGNSLSTDEEMEEFVHQRNPNAPYLAKLYLHIGKEEGVRGDLAFSQALIDTNYFNDANYHADSYNYISIRTHQSDGKPVVFQNPSEGIRAHIQHLKAYGSTQGLNTPLVDPIFHLVPRGSVLYWEDIDKDWFLPQENYGLLIIKLWRSFMKLQDHEENFDEESNLLKYQGIIPEGVDTEKSVTWGELIQVLNKILINR